MQSLQTKAEKFFAQGNFTQALYCYRQMPANVERDGCIRLCLKMMARKLWKQERPIDFCKVMFELKGESHLALAHAVLSGKEEVERLAVSGQGLLSQLAFCKMQDDLKRGLLEMRKIPELRHVAEGWIALSKGDHQRALNSFAMSGESMPAIVGKGVVFLLQGNREEAEKLLKKMRPFAGRRFPVLGKAMGWIDAEQEMTLDLLHAPIEKLIDAEKRVSSYEIKGWIALRKGDKRAEIDVEEANRSWNLAEKLHAGLRLDVYKRRFLSELHTSSSENLESGFFRFYKILVKEKPKDVKIFLESIVLDDSKSFANQFVHTALWHPNRGWSIDPPPLAIELLWLFLISKQSAQYLCQLILFPSAMSEFCIGMPWEKWELFFAQLDSEYGDKEFYLLLKLSILKIFRKPQSICDCIARLLQLNFHLIEEWMPLYVKNFFELSVEERKKLDAQIDTLCQCFPAQFDLLRLKLLTQSNAGALLSSWVIQMPDQLYKVLLFQNVLDIGCNIKTAKPYLLPAASLGKNKEADWRYVAALYASKLPFAKNNLKEILHRIADKGEYFSVLQQLARYGISAPFTILTEMKRTGRGKDWRPYYYLALFYALQGDRQKCIENLMQAELLTPHVVPEFSSIKITLDFYETYNGPDAIKSSLLEGPSSFAEMLRVLLGGKSLGF